MKRLCDAFKRSIPCFASAVGTQGGELRKPGNLSCLLLGLDRSLSIGWSPHHIELRSSQRSIDSARRIRHNGQRGLLHEIKSAE